MNGPEPVVEQDANGKTMKLTVDADIAVMATGESLEEQAVILFSDEKHGLPTNLAEMLEEHFDSRPGPEGPFYGRLRLTIERS